MPRTLEDLKDITFKGYTYSLWVLPVLACLLIFLSETAGFDAFTAVTTIMVIYGAPFVILGAIAFLLFTGLMVSRLWIALGRLLQD